MRFEDQANGVVFLIHILRFSGRLDGDSEAAEAFPMIACRARRLKAFTAIEVSVSLVVVSFLSIFTLHAYREMQLLRMETDQVDCAVQIARDALSEIKARKDWDAIQQRNQSLRRSGAEFTFQILPKETEDERLVDLELTISWIGPRKLEQLVFNTTVLGKMPPEYGNPGE